MIPVASSSKRRGASRAFWGALALAAEYLALGVYFDGGVLTGGHDWWAGFGRIGGLVSISIAVFTAGLLVRGRELLASLSEATTDLAALEPRWAIAHVAAFAAFTAVTSRLFGGTPASSLGMSLAIVGWLALGGAAFVTLFRLTFGSAWRAVARALSGLFAAGLALGLLAWVASVQSVALWRWLAGATLRTSSWMLVPFVGSVRVVPEEMLLALGNFGVIVEAPCSGMENLGAVSVFLLGYLYAFREKLRFPQSFLLVPAALLAVWVMNALRIATLVVIGAYWSPEIALGGFHSKAGWIALCVVALGVVVATRNSPRFAQTAPAVAFTESSTAAYLMPLLTFVAVGLLTGLLSTGVDWLYPASVLAAGAVAWRYRKEYPMPARRVPWWGLSMGVVAFAFWIALAKNQDAGALAAHARSLAGASAGLRAAWLTFRVMGAVVVVPIIEELAFRGFLQRRVIADDFTSVSQGRFTWPSFVVSALAFGLLHDSWLAGAAAGGLYSVAGYRGGRLEEAIVAHATTNALLVFAALVLGHANLWQ